MAPSFSCALSPYARLQLLEAFFLTIGFALEVHFPLKHACRRASRFQTAFAPSTEHQTHLSNQTPDFLAERLLSLPRKSP
jgi:hypothetical protein